MKSYHSRQKKIVFRVDSSQNIGSGHVMRCLTLADALKEFNSEVIFICRDLTGNIIDFIEASGYKVSRLQTNSSSRTKQDLKQHSSWLGSDWEQDAQETINILKNLNVKPKFLIVDHYAIDHNWEVLTRSVVEKIMVIDDLADRRHDCDLLLDQNFYVNPEQRYKGLVPDNCIKLLGPSYALLRPEFRDKYPYKEKKRSNNKNIFVFFGGIDPNNETAKTLKAIFSLKRHKLTADIVVGEKNQHKSLIKKLCKDHSNITLHSHIDNMAELMSHCHVAVGAGGTTTWERFCLGIPSIVISIAANQKENAKYCCRCGCHMYLGDSNEVSSFDISAAINTAFQSPTLLQHISEQAKKMVDGKGIFRVIPFLLPPSISLRPAVLSDCQDIYNWRNAKETRLRTFDKETIPLDVHQRWFEQCLVDENRILLIGECDDKPLGVLRFDLENQEALVSVYLVPGQKTAGTGFQLIHSGSNWLRKNCPNIKIIEAKILNTNIASKKAFQKAGYSLCNLTFSKEL